MFGIDNLFDSVEVLGNVNIVLVGTTHPGNIGAAARAMKTMGLSSLVLVSPKLFPHVDATARASGADDILYRAKVVDSLRDAVGSSGLVLGTSTRVRSLDWPEYPPAAAAAKLIEAARAGSVSVVFGREHSGLTNAELDVCQAMLRIPAEPDFSSLNLASAVQILAYELRNALNLAPPDGEREMRQRPSSDELEGFYSHLEQALVDIGYMDPEQPKRLRRRLRRLFSRAQPDRPEINILRGILTAAQRHRES